MCMLQSETLEVEYLFDARDYSRPDKTKGVFILGKGGEVVSVL